jgi:hypothetical protein
MTDKHWLIRTRSKQILGPATLEKIVSLLEKGTLKDEDEVSSGNGYWFWIKEKELVTKYIYNGKQQGFDPISEAHSVLSEKDTGASVAALNTKPEQLGDDDQMIPSEEDLEYPDAGIVELEIENSVDKDSHEEDEDFGDLTMVAAVERDRSVVNSLLQEEGHQASSSDKDSLVIEKLSKKPKQSALKVKKANDRYLFILLAFVVILLACVIFYFKKILNKPIPLFSIASVHAQSGPSLIKKKVL